MSRRESLATSRGPVRATVTVPGSKSVANRALVCASLAGGSSRLTNLPPGDDTKAMIDGLRTLGVGLDGSPPTVDVRGGALRGGSTLDAELAGTTSRFLIALAALLVEPSVVTGGEALRRRPMGDLVDALRDLGATVDELGSSGCLPVRVGRGSLRGGAVRIAGDTSSQFVSALMMIGPRLDGGLSIELTSRLVSRPYVEMTSSVMAAFGVGNVAISDSRIVVPETDYRPAVFEVEPDASSASYPLATAAITGGSVTVDGLARSSSQGDSRIVEILADMGCTVSFDAAGVTVSGAGSLRGIDVDMADVSDLVPTVACAAAFAATPTRVRGVGFIRHKESDRLAALVDGLGRIGCAARETADGLVVEPSDATAYHGAELPTHHDHRLAMAWSLLALRVPGIELDDASVVAKSWPDWWSVRSSMLAGGGR